MRLTLAWLIALILCSGSIAFAQQQRNQDRGRAMPHYKLGLEELRSEQWEKAAAAFSRALEIDPTFEMAYYALGRAYMPQKKYAEAAAALTKCRDLYQTDAGRLFSNAQDAQQHRRDRVTELDELIRQYQSGPQTVQSGETLRQLYETRRQMQDNIQRGTNMSIDVSVPSYVSLALGSALFRLGRLADAEREYKAALAADPKIGEAHSNLAVVYLQTGRFEDAERSVKAAEKAGFKVNPMLKDDIAARKKAGQ
ncbi:MAG: Tetratricopeptide repeat [Acidobacteriota bacterium]|jgi:tetratricopeptide (TPR) repeat protein